MKEMMLTAAFVTLLAGTAYAGSDSDHGADRSLNQALLQSRIMVKVADQPLAEESIAGGGHRTDGVAPRGGRK